MTTDTPAQPAVLHGYGPLPWEDAAALLTGAQCAWTDLAGLNLGTAPDQAPLATHLWAWWPDGRCARLRLDDQLAYTAILHPGDHTTTPPAPTGPCCQSVQVLQQHDAPLWGEHDTQAGPLPPQLRAHTWDLLEIPGPAPVTFIRATPTSTA